ncbi:ParB/RepB/Spo0J family partition protein [Methylococcus geothermalis]|uniref:Probable chromosome-partitioning protein ParB n=1 Tax=Methylococcus geothermalis TaxID=2681310 RepID=A0A858Q534_9GAMM|nr:ParB/RepB/Spo0J family partition protein [Methylococcus geothermalis]QJD28925.1 ParB/RepB/Spo0J family partition protein [Methylococcus geothermalis]
MKRPALGRGLEALLGEAKLDSKQESLRKLPIEHLEPSPFQPRKDFDSAKLRELADSISAQGIVQPIVVRSADQGRYQIVAGERRWRAAQLAGIREVPVVVREVPDQAALAIALIENIQREDLNPMEEAEAIRRLLEEHRMTHQQVADALGKSRVTITNLNRLNDLHADVKALLRAGEIDMGHARALLTLPPGQQGEVARRIADKRLSVREAESLVNSLLKTTDAGPKSAVSTDPDIARLERRMAEQLGAGVRIQHGGKGAGKLVISYASLEQLEGLLARFGG